MVITVLWFYFVICITKYKCQSTVWLSVSYFLFYFVDPLLILLHSAHLYLLPVFRLITWFGLNQHHSSLITAEQNLLRLQCLHTDTTPLFLVLIAQTLDPIYWWAHHFMFKLLQLGVTLQWLVAADLKTHNDYFPSNIIDHASGAYFWRWGTWTCWHQLPRRCWPYTGRSRYRPPARVWSAANRCSAAGHESHCWVGWAETGGHLHLLGGRKLNQMRQMYSLYSLCVCTHMVLYWERTKCCRVWLSHCLSVQPLDCASVFTDLMTKPVRFREDSKHVSQH